VAAPRLAAYVLAADPSWSEESVRSYYDLVDRIVVSYDETGTSWSGTPMPSEEALRRLRSVDVAGKMEFAPGRFYRPGHHPLENDTHQRQTALAQAGTDADWVIQLDTDEVLADPDEFLSCLHRAVAGGYTGLEYPARVIYQHVRDDWYLEGCSRHWSVAAHYPGPVAVRRDANLVMARQADVQLFRVDFRRHNTDRAHPADAPIHRVVRPAQGILHYSWVRSDESMAAKSRASGHSGDFDWDPVIAQWRDFRDHPVRAMLGTPLRRGPRKRLVRLARLPGAPDAGARRRNGLRG
jgi:hypothetical protein